MDTKQAIKIRTLKCLIGHNMVEKIRVLNEAGVTYETTRMLGHCKNCGEKRLMDPSEVDPFENTDFTKKGDDE
jgi:hypothetical protein